MKYLQQTFILQQIYWWWFIATKDGRFKEEGSNDPHNNAAAHQYIQERQQKCTKGLLNIILIRLLIVKLFKWAHSVYKKGKINVQRVCFYLMKTNYLFFYIKKVSKVSTPVFTKKTTEMLEGFVFICWKFKFSNFYTKKISIQASTRKTTEMYRGFFLFDENLSY